MKILLIEDDITISDYILKGLKESGFSVDVASDGEVGLHFIKGFSYELIIVDLMLPKIGGLEIVSELRRMGKRVPVLILSAMRSVDDKVKGLELGGDDYLTKPFSYSELLARIQALLRRSNAYGQEVSSNFIETGDIKLDIRTRKAYRNTKQIDLQGKEFSLLEYFMRHPNAVLTKTQIMEAVWDSQFDPQTNVVDVLVFRLRNKIDRDSEKTIMTIRGVGYLFKPNQL